MNPPQVVATTDFSPPETTAKTNAHTLSVYVNNVPGVLMRICQVFARRAYNIDALVVSHARDNRLSRMTITISGDPEGLSQIIKQIDKLVDVIHCIEHGSYDSVAKELALLKIVATPDNFLEISQVINQFGGKIVDSADGTLIVMINGNSEKIDWALQILAKFKVIEAVRTGKLVIARSSYIT